MAGLTTETSLVDSDIFIRLIDVCKEIVADDRVPAEHKQAIRDAIDEAELRNNKRAKVLYECDGLACEECNKRSEGRCHHTHDIKHAKNFAKPYPNAAYMENARTQEGQS